MCSPLTAWTSLGLDKNKNRFLKQPQTFIIRRRSPWEIWRQQRATNPPRKSASTKDAWRPYLPRNFPNLKLCLKESCRSSNPSAIYNNLKSLKAAKKRHCISNTKKMTGKTTPKKLQAKASPNPGSWCKTEVISTSKKRCGRSRLSWRNSRERSWFRSRLGRKTGKSSACVNPPSTRRAAFYSEVQIQRDHALANQRNACRSRFNHRSKNKK